MRTTQPPDTEPLDATHCRHCGHPVIRAFTDGLDTRCDPDLLDIPAEITSHLAGIPTYQLLAYHDGHLELARRTATRIHWQPDAPVVAEHRCPPTQRFTHRQVLQLPPPVQINTRPAVRRTTGDQPPF